MVPSGPLAPTTLRSTPSLPASARTAGLALAPRASRAGLAGASAFAFSSAGISPTTVPVSAAAAASNSTSGAPILTISPGSANNRLMRPDWGAGISTTAFSVSTETSG